MSEVRKTVQMIMWSLSCHPSCGSIFPGNYAHHPLNYPLINSTAFVLAAYLVTYMLAVIAEVSEALGTKVSSPFRWGGTMTGSLSEAAVVSLPCLDVPRSEAKLATDSAMQ